ncbi:hypothetical protein NDU88_000843 [Pleurodeles waltl]|uniref:Uncharacterized protein n=1 Tax=Pleurodeles waltl TaxID=8319 RepID=A0AAV7N933_PLEWA|nr:hypothetical protein NDU88_000843 [Pleurodeles waltl]
MQAPADHKADRQGQHILGRLDMHVCPAPLQSSLSVNTVAVPDDGTDDASIGKDEDHNGHYHTHSDRNVLPCEEADWVDFEPPEDRKHGGHPDTHDGWLDVREHQQPAGDHAHLARWKELIEDGDTVVADAEEPIGKEEIGHNDFLRRPAPSRVVGHDEEGAAVRQDSKGQESPMETNQQVRSGKQKEACHDLHCVS